MIFLLRRSVGCLIFLVASPVKKSWSVCGVDFQLANFRMVFIDNETLTISQHKNTKEGHDKCEHGKKTPYLVFKSEPSSTSLYTSFEILFNNTWNKKSKDLIDRYKMIKKKRVENNG